MRHIYQAANTIDANLLKGLLEHEGIEAFVNGEYLTGGIGELPASGIVTLSVEEGDVAQALKIINAFEAGEYALRDDDTNLG